MPTEEQMRMDAAAEDANKELIKHFDEWSARAVAKWWTKWYLKAGHKRLGRLLVEIAKQMGDQNTR